MAATRARRRSGLVQFMVTMPIAERDEIARLGYEAIASQDQQAAGEAQRPTIISPRFDAGNPHRKPQCRSRIDA
jgi:hypothetical protein